MGKLFQVLVASGILTMPSFLCLAQKADSLLEKDIVILLDNSGSMKQNDPDLLTKRVVNSFTKKVDTKTKIALLIFDKDVKVSMPLTMITATDIESKVKKGLETVNYKGMHTNIPIAVERAIYELKMNSKANSSRSIILLTDGTIDTGDKSKDVEKQNWLEHNLTEEARKEDIKIFGIAFTESADFQLMQLLAQRTGGGYYRALTAKDIEPVFNKIHENINVRQPAAKGQLPKEELASSEKTNYLFLLGVVVVVVVGIIAVIILVQSRSPRRQIAVQRSSSDDPAKEGPVSPAKLIGLEDKAEHLINKATYSIGRKKEGDLCIPTDTVSGTHAFIKYRDNKYFINDNHSSNSTYVNGKQIDSGVDILLRNNDEIRFDIYRYVFELPNEEEDNRTVLRNVNKQIEDGTVLRKKEIKPAIQLHDEIGQKLPDSNIPEKKGEEGEQATALKQIYCPNHPAFKATELCPDCKKAYCKACMVEKDKKARCKNCADRIVNL